MSPSPFRFRKASSKDPVRPKKSLGQNFLVDRNVIGRMIDACSFSKDEVVLEIGPGTGALTREIAPRVKRLIAVETDGPLVERLRNEFKESNVEIIHADFLKCDLSQLLGKLKVKVVGNLPYYISTPIMTKVVENRHVFTEFFLTVQQEFAERIVASPGSKDYSSFSCFNQFYTSPQMLFRIKSSAFKPAPKVDSCFLKLTMRKLPAFPCDDEKFLFHVIRTGFAQRRKTLVNALSSLVSKEQLIELFPKAGLAPNVRAEEVGLKQYVLLADLVRKEIQGADKVSEMHDVDLLNEFNDLVERIFDPFLADMGFGLKSKKIDQFFCDRIYRRKKQYIKIMANVHPRDLPAYWNIVLGEGNTEMPEGDWNAVALWCLMRREGNDKAKEYSLVRIDLKKLQKDVQSAKSDLEKFGKSFLDGDLRVFCEIRDSVNKDREPYRVYTPLKGGGLSVKELEKWKAPKKSQG